jgi:ABC-type lipoprotein release transport system permease subunit
MVTGLRAAGETGPDGILTSLPAESLPGPGEVLVGQGLAQEMGIHPGVTLALMGQAVDGSVASGLYRVKAIVTTVIDPINRLGIVMDLGTARDFLAMGDEVHELAVHVDTPRNIPGVLAGLKGDSLLSGLEVIDWKGLAPQLATLLQVTESVNLIIIVLLFVATVAGIANTMLMATFERSREMGMLLALGCRPRRLIGILFLEATVLGTTGVFIGSILGILIVAYQAAHGIDLSAMVGGRGSLTVEGLDLGGKLYPVLKVTDIARGVIAVIVTSILAVLWPARRVSRLEPMEAMRA